MSDFITLNHGSGGNLTHSLIRNLFVKSFGMTEPLTDSALLKESGYTLAFTTDSYVVDPLFFPGGNIGKLAVCGTVNDLAVSGAVPLYMAVSFIIEEGFPFSDLEIIVRAMAEEAANAGVKIVTGDTKVVEKGKCDKIFITTSGTGILTGELGHIGTGERIQTGDKLIINGPVGNHAIAVLGARNNLSFSSPVVSDCVSLNHLVRALTEECSQIHFMRDLTRGGLGTVLNELAQMTGSEIIVDESAIPVDEPVRGLCEILGFDALYLANEGKVLIAAGKDEYQKVLEILRSHDLGKESAVIGEVISNQKGLVFLRTSAGGKRILEIPSGTQLPRIC